MIKGWWTDRLLPRATDKMLDTGPVHKLRAEVCRGLHGRVLEVGFGSGLNLSHYPDAVTSVDAVEPSDVAWRLAEERIASAAMPVVRSGLDGQRLAAPSASYDAVLSTFTLCTIPDVSAALAEVRRVLRPGGTLHFLEHGLSPSPNLATWQRRLTPLQKRVAGGCHLDRAMDTLMERAGFRVEHLTTDYLSGPPPSRPWGYVYRGAARA